MAGRFQRQSRRYPGAARRAQRTARRETAPARRQANRDIAKAQRQGQQAAKGARQTYSRQAAYEQQLAQNLPKGIATPGLVQKQLMAGAAQSQKYGGALAKLAQRASRQDVQELQESQQGVVRQTAAANLATIVAEKRQAEKEREAAAEEQKAAMAAAKRELRFNISRIPVKDLGLLHSQPARDDLAKKLASTEGITLTPEEARAMVERMYAKLRPTLPSPFLSDEERRGQSMDQAGQEARRRYYAQRR